MRTQLALPAALVVLASLSGCASIVSGSEQSLSVVAMGESGNVNGARCSLSNDKGQWYTTTPGSVTVRRSYSDMAVTCQNAKTSGALQVKSATKGMAFGNILFGGIIGAGVDMSTGAAYDYPALITIQMLATQAIQAPDASPSPLGLAPVTTTAQPAQVAPVAPAIVVPPLDPPAKTPSAPLGQESFQVERLPEVKACSAQPRATLTAKGPGVESYSVACSNGDFLSVRCEFSNCRVLK